MALSVMTRFMNGQISERRASIREDLANDGSGADGDDVFSKLLQANELEERPKLRLDDSELIRQTFSPLVFPNHRTIDR